MLKPDCCRATGTILLRNSTPTSQATTRISVCPTIQGVIVVFDANNGVPLAILDSIDITLKRTAGASAVAAKYLARKDSSVATICGCGQQGRAQLRAALLVLPLTKIYAFDVNERAAMNFRNELSSELKIGIEPVRDLASAIQRSDVCITCTTANEFFVRKGDVRPVPFIAQLAGCSTQTGN